MLFGLVVKALRDITKDPYEQRKDVSNDEQSVHGAFLRDTVMDDDEQSMYGSSWLFFSSNMLSRMPMSLASDILSWKVFM
jgi:hypothetical protein